MFRSPRQIGVLLLGVFAPLALLLLAYVGYVWNGDVTGVARVTGTIDGLGVGAPVRIVRDDRDVPHIRAASLHDAFFAQGYVTGSDRLFQIDITRRYMLGQLGELLGPSGTPADDAARVFDLRDTAAAEYGHLAPDLRAELQAYADGVNAAATREPLPPEYHALLTTFVPWKPEDSLVVGFATVLALTDRWDDVIARDEIARTEGPRVLAAFYPLSDPRYDVAPAGGARFPIPPLPPLPGVLHPAKVAWDGFNVHDSVGSNSWVAGAARTATGRALLANDPHLARSIPGIWVLVDIQAPGFHAAGATLAGVPGVIVGHNDRLAWGATSGYAASPRVFRETFTDEHGVTYRAGSGTLEARERTEDFVGRFGSHKRTYLSTRHGFVVEDHGTIRHAVQWWPEDDTRSPVAAFLELDRADSIEAALRALAGFPGPTQNFTLASTDGRAAYTQAGFVPVNAAWGLGVFDGQSTAPQPLSYVPFAALPHVAPGRGVLLVSANNLPYAAGYPYRLSPSYAPPYRAAEITSRLGNARVSVEQSRAIQADTTSLGERELAQMCVAALRKNRAQRDPDLAPTYAALVAFGGAFDPASTGATAAQRIRVTAMQDLTALHLDAAATPIYLREGPAFVTLMRALREHPHGWFPNDDPSAFLVAEVRETVKLWGGRDAVAVPYGPAYTVVARHPLSSLGYHGWDGPPFPGSGGSYAPAVQGIVIGQSLRAVWDVGAWDTGGIDIPLGESGEPGSPHYTDRVPAWLAHQLTPLPFSDGAVQRAARSTVVLTR